MRDLTIKLLKNVADLALLQPGDVICDKRYGMKVVMNNEKGKITVLGRRISEPTVIDEELLKPHTNHAVPYHFYNDVDLVQDIFTAYRAEPPNPEYQARDKILRDAGL